MPENSGSFWGTVEKCRKKDYDNKNLKEK